jgi:hypothetical protein
MAYRSESAMVVYEMMADLHKEGIIDDAALHEFDDCLVLEPAANTSPYPMMKICPCKPKPLIGEHNEL